jgi:ABC-type transport system substrate-binding protein
MSKNIRLLFILIPALLLLKACGTSDTVTVVPDAPRPGVAKQDTLDDDDEDFQHLRIGVIDPVTNLDPLFADNLSTMRVISLIYEGLFTLNPEGEAEAQLVREIEVSDDGREYLFKIKTNIFYHDSRAFIAGVGRRLHANDIKWAFERTAHSNIPPHASALLMNVEGYRNYFLEQREVYDRSKRVLEGVSGIEVIDRETIRFLLNREDPDFLKKLSSPYLTVYPREGVERADMGLRSAPVGTGHYQFISAEEGRIMLSLNSSENAENRSGKPNVNRIDFIHASNESELFQKFNRHEIDWIPELGPQISRQVVSSDDSLVAAYRNQFTLVNQEPYRRTSIFINKNSTAQTEWLANRLTGLAVEEIDFHGTILVVPEGLPALETEESDSQPDSEYFISFTDNLTARYALSIINSQLLEPDASLAFFDIRISTPETSFFTSVSDSFHHSYHSKPDAPWLTIFTPIFGLNHTYIRGIEPTMVPWKIHVEPIRVQDSERRES